jgi:hypothetical protein
VLNLFELQGKLDVFSRCRVVEEEGWLRRACHKLAEARTPRRASGGEWQGGVKKKRPLVHGT